MAPEFLYRYEQPIEGPFKNGDEFAAAVVEEVEKLPRSPDELMQTPEEAELSLPHPSKWGKLSPEQTDEEFWSETLMTQGLSHETRTCIVIAKAGKALPYWRVKEVLHRIEREGERAGWLPYGVK